VHVEVSRPVPVFDTVIRPNQSALYPEFVEEISVAVQNVKTNESTLLWETSVHTLRTMERT